MLVFFCLLTVISLVRFHESAGLTELLLVAYMFNNPMISFNFLHVQGVQLTHLGISFPAYGNFCCLPISFAKFFHIAVASSVTGTCVASAYLECVNNQSLCEV